jgi:hypothetical protein
MIAAAARWRRSKMTKLNNERQRNEPIDKLGMGKYEAGLRAGFCFALFVHHLLLWALEQ